jgi:hemin uptake protein HemP
MALKFLNDGYFASKVGIGVVAPSANLEIVGSGGTVLDVQGSQGQLFSVTDSLTGDIFAVSDISGIPILTVNSSGAVTIDGSLNLGDSDTINIGGSNDLQIYHNATDSVIENNVGDLYITNKADDKDIVFRSDDGSGGYTTYFFLDGSQTNVNFQKDAIWTDSKKALFGGSGDLQIYHNGSDSFITDQGTGIIYLQGDSQIKIRSNSGENYAIFNENAAVELYYDNVKKLETTTFGSKVTGYIQVTSGVDVIGGNIDLVDNSKIRLGTSQDLQIYHNGSTSYIDQTGVGKLVLNTLNTGINIQAGSGETRFTISGINSEIKVDDASQVNKVVLKASGNSYLNGGNVGIGTTSPASKLDLYNGTDLGLGANGIRVQRPGAYGQYGYLEYLFSSDVTVLGSLYTGGGASAFGQIYFRQHSSTTSRDIMVINSSGNVGIGTTNPASKLHVNVENAISTVAISRGGSDLTAGTALGNIVFPADYGGTPTTYASIDAYANALSGVRGSLDFNVKSTSGTLLTGMTVYGTSSGVNVGIGTASPSYKLDVVGEGKVTGKFRVGGAVMLAEPGTGVLLFGSEGGSQTAIYSASQERIRINGSGNVGIGTTSPSAKLQVLGIAEDNQIVGAGVTSVTEITNSYVAAFGRLSELIFSTSTGGGTSRLSAISSAYTGWNAAGLSGDLRFSTRTVGDSALSEKMRIDSAGAIKFNAYNSTNQTGTPTYLLGTDASGNIVKTNTVPGSAAGPYITGTGSLSAQDLADIGNLSGTNTGDQTNISGNAATVTTNANLTGHVTSVGNAAVLGSFTVAQLSAALSDASISGTNTGDQSLAGYATETYVGQRITDLIDSSPSTLNTLNELAAALGDDPNFATTVATSIGNKIFNNADDSFSGILTGTGTGENLKIGGIRGTTKGSQTGEYIHLYERVHVGGPSGWGAGTHGAPANGLSTWGSVDFGMNGAGVIQLDGTTIVTAARALTNITNYGLSSGDIPNNAANTSGSAGSLSTIPTWNQNTTGNAATATTATNSTQLNGFTLARIDHAEDFHTYTGLNASAAQAKRYHVGRLYGCPAHWDGDWQNIEIHVTAESYESANLRFAIMGDYTGANNQASMLKLYLKEASGPYCNHFRFVMGTPVDAGWDYSGQDTYYVDLYAEVKSYGQFKMNVKSYGHDIKSANPTSGGATTVFYDSPTVSDISAFTEEHNTLHHLTSEIYHEGHKPTLSELGAQAAGSYVTANAAITGATKAKITYDAKGLVTAGADLASADIPNNAANTSGNAATATLAANSTLAGGLAIGTGVNNSANQIVRTDGNGYAQFGWINSASGATTSTITRITASDDAYLRYVTPATFRSQVIDPYYAPIVTGGYLPLSGGVMTGKIGRSSAIVGFLEGSYNNVGANGTNTNPIYTIGSSYNPASTTLSNMYGVGFTSAGASFITNTGATDWGFYVAADGDARVWLDGTSGNISGTGNVYASGGNSTEWNTAYTHSQATHAPSNAEQNVQSDWNAASGDAFILNKPTIPSGNAVIDWTQAGAGTIHTDNYIENVVQTTVSGSSGSCTGNACYSNLCHHCWRSA